MAVQENKYLYYVQYVFVKIKNVWSDIVII